MQLKDDFLELCTPGELFEFMRKNIKYGWIGTDNQIRINTIEGLIEKYRVSSLEEIFNSGVGICFEQVELEREFFQKKGYTIDTYAIFNNHMIHTFLMFKQNDKYYKFEHSSSKCRGIYEYNNIFDLLNAEINSFMVRHNIKNTQKLFLIKYHKLYEYYSIQDIKKEFTSKKENLISIYKPL